MKRIIKALVVSALMVVLMATNVSPAFAAPAWGYWYGGPYGEPQGYGADGENDGYGEDGEVEKEGFACGKTKNEKGNKDTCAWPV